MKRKFTEEEIKEIWMNDNFVAEIVGEPRRWSTTVGLITEVDGKFYEVVYERGLTERQEDYFSDMEASEVHQVEKITRVWEAK